MRLFHNKSITQQLGMGANPGGGGGGHVPHDFEDGGHNIKCPLHEFCLT